MIDYQLRQVTKLTTIINDTSTSELTNSEIKVLKVIVQRPDYRSTQKQIVVMVGYSPKGGSYKNNCSHLRSLWCIYYQNDYMTATQQGINQRQDVEPHPTDPDLIQNFWYSR